MTGKQEAFGSRVDLKRSLEASISALQHEDTLRRKGRSHRPPSRRIGPESRERCNSEKSSCCRRSQGLGCTMKKIHPKEKMTLLREPLEGSGLGNRR
jgi:hypothetical protein